MLQNEYGYDHIRAQHADLSAQLAHPDDARLLKVPANGPVLPVPGVYTTSIKMGK